ncbi:hypothetical protein Tco_0921734 [Tanacetum coccineum]
MRIESIPPKTTEQKLERKNELIAKSTLLLAIPDEHILKFHGIKDAKTLWEAIKTRAPRNQGNRNGDASRRIVPVENPANALVQPVHQVLDSDRFIPALKIVKTYETLQKTVRDNSITKLKNQLAKALKEKDDLKLKLEKFETSSKKLTNWDMRQMLLSPQHAGFGDQHEMLLTISPKRVDHTCLKDLTMLIHKADSSQPWLRHMTGNKFYLSDYQDIDGGFVAFGGSSKGGKITGKGKIRTDKLYFEDAYFIKKLKFNVFSVSQMCDKKYSVLFTETECLVLSPNFKLLEKVKFCLKSRQKHMYSLYL